MAMPEKVSLIAPKESLTKPSLKRNSLLLDGDLQDYS